VIVKSWKNEDISGTDSTVSLVIKKENIKMRRSKRADS
jgi:hypothetical protein